MNTIRQKASERRQYEQKGCKYLLNDEAKTAWIVRGARIGRRRRFRVPDHIMVEGERYTVESVEIGAFRGGRRLRHLVIPDSIAFVDEYNFSSLHCLRSVYVGKGLESVNSWIFGGDDKLRSFIIDKGNEFLKIKHGVIYSKDGRTAFATPFRPKHLSICEGTEEIWATAFWFNERLESVGFPSTLKRIGDNSLSSCPRLTEVVLPEGFEECVVQCFMDNENLRLVDFPSTMTDYGYGTLENCPKLESLIIRCKQVMKVRDGELDFAPHCTIYVPAELVEEYRKHPIWGKCKEVKAME